jgi:hypothetical protein
MIEAANVTFAANPPADPLRKAAHSIDSGTKLTDRQVAWAAQHDWFVAGVTDGANETIEGDAAERQCAMAGSGADDHGSPGSGSWSCGCTRRRELG